MSVVAENVVVSNPADLTLGAALVTGHCAGRLSAVAAHPILPEVATVGEDMTLRSVEFSKKKILFFFESFSVVFCCSFPNVVVLL
jgi:hypothetical protein